jgi:hypothetical protein
MEKLKSGEAEKQKSRETGKAKKQKSRKAVKQEQHKNRNPKNILSLIIKPKINSPPTHVKFCL